ncbi:MAG: NAD(P)/FAD-dependent oxidoreductase [Firmicutes bacterium]|nr:NAD(P)/FAD-dependent oxidoreductase [Bacillota bacterium]
MTGTIVVVGGGASGLMAAGVAAAYGANVVLLEKTKRLGAKIRIFGKGRCNITNTVDLPEFIKNYPENGRFLYSALTRFSNWDTINFFNELGVETKIERGQRVFPVSDDADQVANALVRHARNNGAKIFSQKAVRKLILSDDGRIAGVETTDNEFFDADAVILATGGASYPGTGSTGDGFLLAKQVGHTIQKPFPSLVPLRVKESWVKSVAGVSLRNVEITIDNGKESDRAFGEMLFTHFGVSGPIVLTLSRKVAKWLENKESKVELTIDLKPALSFEILERRVQRDFNKYIRKQLKNSLDDLLPKSLIPIVIIESGIEPEKYVNQVTKAERRQLVNTLKALRLTIVDTLGIPAAIVTAGGVNLTEIDPRTMRSKLIENLYFAGEVIDIDGFTGGFNLQAAFSTGYLAGISATNHGERRD